MSRWVGIFALMAAASAIFFACEEPVESLCEVGSEVFCKCRGGDSGTKTCLGDGNSYGECTTNSGSCPEIEDPTSTTGLTPVCLAGEEVPCTCDNDEAGVKLCADDGLSFGDCTVDGGACGSGSGDKLLYSPCAEGGECLTGTCASGYCTRTCEIFTDCYDDENELYGDCIALAGNNQCAPYCLSQADCLSVFGEPSACGGATALDDADVAFGACADWGAELQGMPYGTLCDAESGEILIFGGDGQLVVAECSLGAPGVQNYCFADECTKVCYEDVDCPEMNCSSNGSVAGCCETEPECN